MDSKARKPSILRRITPATLIALLNKYGNKYQLSKKLGIVNNGLVDYYCRKYAIYWEIDEETGEKIYKSEYICEKCGNVIS